MTILILACVALTAAVLAAMLWPLLRTNRAVPERAEFDLAVYRDQLKELDRDVTRGLLGPQEATAARLEIQRRMIAPQAATPTAVATRSRGLAAVVALVVIVGTGGLYLRLGAPGIPDQPAASVVKPAASGDQKAAHVNMASAAATLEAKLKEEPDNAERWLLYARTTASMGRWDDAIAAYKNVMRLEPDQSDIISSYGEMLVMASEGMVTPNARKAFMDAVRLDPKEQVARFYLGLADMQAGEPKLALETWMQLAPDAPAGSEIRGEVERRIAEAAKAAGVPMPRLPPPAPAEAPAPAAGGAAPAGGPDAAAMAAAANMTPEQRAQMIGGMVKQLAAKLEENPNDADGWLKIGRAYMVMGDPDKSADAYERAAKLKPGDVSVPLQEVEALLDNRTPEAPIPQRAIALLRKIEASNPKEPQALWLLGVSAAQADQASEAVGYWTRLLAQLPADGADATMVRGAIEAIKKPK